MTTPFCHAIPPTPGKKYRKKFFNYPILKSIFWEKFLVSNCAPHMNKKPPRPHTGGLRRGVGVGSMATIPRHCGGLCPTLVHLWTADKTPSLSVNVSYFGLKWQKKSTPFGSALEWFGLKQPRFLRHRSRRVRRGAC